MDSNNPTNHEEELSPFRPDDPAVCPYCGRRPAGVGMDVYSDDHIFMDAIGGKKTVRVCKPCNDRCGGTFEAKNLKDTIIRLSILSAQLGVSIAKKDLEWKNAVSTPDGHVYNLVLAEDGVQLQSAKPLVIRDPDDSSVLHITVNNDPESRKLLKSFANSKKLKLESESPGQSERTQTSSFELELNKIVGLTALKMAFASATVTFPDEISNFKNARLDLSDAKTKSRVRSVIIDHRTHAALDAARPPFCHTIYLEECEGIIHGLVQFFGCFQAYIKLSDKATRSYENGSLATLDPTTGMEHFKEIPRLGIRKWTGTEMADQLSAIKKFNMYAKQCGAKEDVLNVSSVTGEDGIERKATWSIPGWSWTGDIPGRKKW